MLETAAFFAALGVSFAIGARAPRWRGLAAVVALLVALQVQVGFSEFPNYELGLATLAPWWAGRQVRRRSLLVAALAQRTRELEAEQDAFARLAVRRERGRIARELHDIVAHHLAVIVVQAGAGRLAPAGRPEVETERFAAIRQAGDQALADMARLVDVLHADGADGARDRMRLLVDEASAGGVEVDFVALGPSAPLPPGVDDAAYRVVREALTNAIKHAPGARVRVRLTVRDDVLEIEVADGGADGAPALAATGSGLGLEGMRERLEALGGRLEAGPAPGAGWRVHARVPLAAPALVPAG
jgi:signal transduction histidine kinase